MFQGEHFNVSKTWCNTDSLLKDTDYILYRLLWSQNYGFSVIKELGIFKCDHSKNEMLWIYNTWRVVFKLKGKYDCYGNVKVKSIYILLAGLPLSLVLSAGFTPDFVWLYTKCTVSVHQQIKIKTALTSALCYYSKVGFKTWGGLSGFPFFFCSHGFKLQVDDGM